MQLEKPEMKIVLSALTREPALSTLIVEEVIDELEEAGLFDVFEQRVTEEGCRLLHTLT